MYATGALNLLVRVDASNFVPCVRPAGHVRGVQGPKSTVPSSAIPGGSVATEWSYRASRALTPVFPVPGGGSARPGLYAGSMSFLFIIVPIPSLVGPLHRPKSHVSFPKRRSQRGVVVSRA